ncbi:MAG: secretin N-terminal domain-containing protein [Limisphaerales bacterium]
MGGSGGHRQHWRSQRDQFGQQPALNGWNGNQRLGRRQLSGGTGWAAVSSSAASERRTPNGTAAGGNTFQQRLQSIISRAAGASGQQDQIQIFGQTKIIADERSNSLLVFATRQDMDSITNIVAKLDVLLSQVLIESIVMEISLGHTWNVGVSAIQQPSAINSPNFKGAGAFNNGQSFFSFATNAIINNGTNTGLANGLSYFGQIGNSDYDIAVQAAESDNKITIIQKPRIQTFQAQPASFFVGSTVPTSPAAPTAVRMATVRLTRNYPLVFLCR